MVVSQGLVREVLWEQKDVSQRNDDMGLKALPWGFRLLGRGKKRGLEGRRQQRSVKRMPFEHTCRISILSSLVFAQIEPFITEHSPVIFRPSLSSIFLTLLLTAGSSHYVIIFDSLFLRIEQ